MVFEFTELQGIMGREYAKVGGENEVVSEAIFEHYLPRFAGDILPQTNSGVALSISDKLDSIAGFFAIGIQPTGSQDPYALSLSCLILLSFSGVLVRPIIFFGFISNTSLGIGISGTNGTFATLMFLLAKYN